MNRAYEQLVGHFAELGKLSAANMLLMWDRNVVMPPAAASTHGEVAGALAAIITAKSTNPAVADWLDAAGAATHSLDDWQAANLREMRRAYAHATAVPAELQVRKAEAVASLNQAWQQARAADDFGVFAPGLREMLALVREIADHKAQALGLAPYDALMDESDPGVTCALVDSVFQPLAQELPGMLETALERQAEWRPLPLNAVHPADQQKALCEHLMQQIGYPMANGRLDATAHPFALPNVPYDQRITTRFKEDDLRFSIMATIHETGHAMYEYHLPKDWRYQPVGVARGATLHESQSLMLEMMASRSSEFLRWLAPELARRFGAGNEAAYSVDNLRLHWQRVRRNLIRIEADELVYPLHVILRYRLERDLLAGRLDVTDIPDAWNALMQELIGITPPSDADGCLQDVHWSFGMFGYFPNYALGEATAAQLFEAACADDPGVLEGLGQGDFSAYFDWVRPRVHACGSSRSTSEIIEAATGQPLSAQPLLRHLRRRYLN